MQSVDHDLGELERRDAEQGRVRGWAEVGSFRQWLCSRWGMHALHEDDPLATWMWGSQLRRILMLMLMPVGPLNVAERICVGCLRMRTLRSYLIHVRSDSRGRGGRGMLEAVCARGARRPLLLSIARYDFCDRFRAVSHAKSAVHHRGPSRR